MKKTVQFFFACALLTTAFSLTVNSRTTETSAADQQYWSWAVSLKRCTLNDGTPGTQTVCIKASGEACDPIFPYVCHPNL